jgi:ABC-2 type transport system permease protein
LYSMMLISVFDSANLSEWNKLLQMKLPQPLIAATGIHFGSTLLSFMANILYGLLMYILPMILMISVNNQLVAAMVENGSLAYVLASPNSRRKIIATQAIYSVFSITVIFLVLGTVDSVFASVVYPGNLDVGQMWQINLYAISFYIALSGISFLASCLANETRQSMMLGAGIPLLFVLFDMLGNYGGSLAWCKYFTLFSLFNPDWVFNGDSFRYVAMLIFAAIAVVLYGSGIWLFTRKNLAM